jgi:hypothetical protein
LNPFWQPLRVQAVNVIIDPTGLPAVKYMVLSSLNLRRAIRRSAAFNQGLRFILPTYRRLAVSSETEVVIEGYPRCANTFAVVAFEMSQPAPLKVAHHLHSVAQLRRGAELSLPTMVLLRNPLDAVTSLAIRKRHRSVRWALEEYVDFHSGALELAERVLLADFKEVTADFGEVVRRFNDRFATNFAVFEHTEANVAKCYEQIDLIERNEAGGLAVRATHVARPSAERQDRKQAFADEFNSPALSPLLREAERLYEKLSEARAGQLASPDAIA